MTPIIVCSFNYLILFLIGTTLGSFINVLSLRFSPGKPVFRREVFFSRSYCPYCKTRLSWYELIPILSFLIQKGKCRHCKKPISWQYPIVELLGGIGLTISFLVFTNNLKLAAVWGLILLVLLLVSIIDLRNLLIPGELVLVLIVLGVVSIFWHPESYLGYFSLMITKFSSYWLNHLAGSLLTLVFFGGMVFFSREKIMGWGDVQMGLAGGLILGWPDIILALMLSFLIGGMAGLFCLLAKKKHRKDYLAFGPFFSLGVVLTGLFGYQILSFYFSSFGF